MPVELKITPGNSSKMKREEKQPLIPQAEGLKFSAKDVGDLCYVGPCQDGSREAYYFAEDGCTDGPYYITEGCD